MTTPDWRGSIRAALGEVADEGSRLGLGRPIAIGWATVELDRAAEELADALGLTVDAFTPAAGSTVLGARCRVAHDGIAPGLALALLEPSTEGRLAAALARHGEGPAAVWFRSYADAVIDATTASAGPFGSERVVRPVPAEAWPRRFLLIAGPGTIDG
jgi:hypothetical protein